MADRIVKVVLRGEIGDLVGKMTAASRSVVDVADKMTAAGREGEKFRRGLDQVGTSAGRMGLAAAIGLGGIVTVAANFEQAMSNVQAATHETAGNMEELREAALRAGADTAFSASEAAAGIENLAKAGVDTRDILDGGLSGALDLAAAGSLEVADAAEAAATAMTQFGLKGSDVPHIADLLAAAAGKAQGEVRDMNFALAQSGLVANQVGLSIEETTGGLAAFASAGLLGSDAGTSFKTMLGALTPNSDKAAGAMEQLGLSAYDAQGNFVGLAEFAGRLQESMANLSDEQRQTTLETIFGSDAVRAASVLYEQGEDGIRKWITAVDDQGFAAETAATKMDNLRGDLEELKGSLETALINMGSGSQGPLRELVQGLTGAVNAFGGLPPAAQNTVTSLLAITAITGGGLWFGSKVVRAVSDTREALDNLGGSGSRASRALKGLSIAGSVVAGIVLLDGALKSLRDTMKDDLPETNALVEQLLDLRDARIKNLPKDFRDLAGSLDDLGQSFGGMERRDVPIVTPFMDLVTWGDTAHESFTQAKDTFEALDTALAQLATSGGIPAAEEAFKALVDAQGLTTEEQERLLKQMPEYKEAITGLSNDARIAGGEVEGLGKNTKGLTQEQIDAKKAANELRAEIRKQAEAWGGLGASVGDAKTSLNDFLTSIEDRAKALNDFSENIDWARGKLDEGLIQAFIDMGEEGAHQLENLANASKTEIDRANAAWRTQQQEIDENTAAVNEFHDAVKKRQERLRIDNAEAKRKLDEVERKMREIDALDPKVTIYVATSYADKKAEQLDRLDRQNRPERGYAAGGYTGAGGKYEAAGIVHRGEYVFSSEATQGNLAMLDTLHRQLRGYSAGGYVGGTASGSVSGVGIDYDRLAHAVARVRPMYGDVHIHDGYEGWKRAQVEDQRRTALTGVQ